ncbi:nucleotidyltransferase [Paenibacillus sp. FSL H7-0326]|uniref:SMODS domain-containing nucleotidyltransferase n=1 Tax=Paenibacillus sp. FSL H7-0326 TaxID=1921144 RepID=UPI00096D39E3|nr:nucleotidyltransferase domain-containing protein [Paenibacillus sp. FSL H7-0326]OMC69087.1 nucleotidyltransferase [Paenibacillus sp. FSL H7-0326]
MSVQSYLESLATQLIIRDEEKARINTSVSTIRSRIASYFGDNITDHFAFGSYTRGTMLTRSADMYSDVDYMVIFKNPNNLKPQTLLNHLRSFAESYYGRSQIKQSHPTMVLELQHIKFELVPAQKDWFGNISIPSPSSSYNEWMSTSPNAFNKKLTDKNTVHGNHIKPLIRLMKYWNCKNNYHLSSYELENAITDLWFFGTKNLKDYMYAGVDALSYSWLSSQDRKDRVDRAKRIVAEAKRLEAAGYPASAEIEIKKLFPPL